MSDLSRESETDIAFTVADRWIDSGKELTMSAGISYLPLHEEAKKIAQEVGKVDIFMGKILCQTNDATQYIQNAVDKGKIGFKRKTCKMLNFGAGHKSYPFSACTKKQ